ncbi:non-ribosomal peptide synthetase [Hahella sp. KA22]|nr:non-ribosomal peptide synthetase [Hahella sp. KA22]
MHPESAHYNIGGYFKIKGGLNIEKFREAIKKSIHSIGLFGIEFDFSGETLRQNFDSYNRNDEISYFDLSKEENPSLAAENWVKNYFSTPFDLNQKYLYENTLLKISDSSHWWVNKSHHILIDGLGYINYGKIVSESYSNLIHDESLEWLKRTPSYQKCINSSKSYFLSEKYQKDRLYWIDQFKSFPSPSLTQKYALGSHKSEHYSLELPTDNAVHIKRLERTFNASLLKLTVAALSIYFSRVNSVDTLTFGLPVHNRRNKEERLTVGMMTGVIPFKASISPEMTLSELIKGISQKLRKSYRHQRYPISHLKRDLKKITSNTGEIFDVLINHEAFNLDLHFDGLKSSFEHLSSDDEMTPLQIRWCDYGANQPLQLKLSYRTDYFSKDEAALLADRIVHMLLSFEQFHDQSIDLIPILTHQETQQLLIDWNQTAAPYPANQCIHELFEAQAVKSPHAVAVVFENDALTYGELNLRANQLAHYLIEQGVKPDTLTGLCVERSLEMIIGLLGILKAGGAYVPLDPSYPMERLGYMIEDSGVELVVTQTALKRSIPPLANISSICLDAEDHQQLLSLCSDRNIAKNRLQLTSQHLAYVIYTSGSTGKPKGVCLEHRGLVNLALAQQSLFDVTAFSRVLQFASLSFDAATWEWCMALIAGASLHMHRQETIASAEALSAVVERQQLTHATLPPAMLAVLDIDQWKSVKHLIVAGDSCPLSLARQWKVNRSFYNAYGPSEATVCCSTYSLAELSTALSIGSPIANTQLYVLSPNQSLQPIGVTGELYIGGAGLARCYLNRPDLTAEKFIPNPFNDDPNDRLYRTGDLARWLPDGNLEFLGRIDHQVKIRGFRIELGEIEAVLLQHEAIREAVVVAREDRDDKRLVAYVVAVADKTASNSLIDELRQIIKQQLPDYMTPAAFVTLDSLPLTPNGKVDRNALPAPDYAASADEFVAPATPTECKLAGIWRSLLKIDRPISANANFFESGGHSLLAVRLATLIRETFSVEVTIKDLFNTPHLSEIAALIEQSVPTALKAPAITPRDPQITEIPLSYAQQRLWFIDQMEGGSAHYNMPGALLLEGRLNLTALNHALSTIIQRHESLRTCFTTVDGHAHQHVLPPPADWALNVVDLHDLGGEALDQAIQQLQLDEASAPFDLSRDYLLRGRLLRLADQRALLLLTMHHIASDGWSIGVLVRELNALYTAFTQGQSNPLPPLVVQYADYALWQRNYLQGEPLEQQVAYWRDQLQGLPEVHQLPLDHPRPSVQTFDGAAYHCVIGKALSDAFKRYCVSRGATLFMGLHAAFSVLLSRYSGETDIVVGSPVANREQAEVASLIGFFVNTLVLRAGLSENPTFDALLQQCRQTPLEAYAHQQVPFEQLVEALQPARHLSHHPLFQVMLALQNNQQETLSLPELTLSMQTPEFTIAKFDLTLNVAEDAEGLTLDWEYNKQLFETATIQRMAGHLNQLLTEIVARPDQSINAYSLLTQQETQQLLVDWNQTAAPYPANQCIHELFEAQTAKTPNAAAVLFEEDALTYGELNRRANQLAHYLIEQGVKPDTLVGLCVERSLEMIIGLLGILKAGGAYVPLDPSYPMERLDYMIEDSGIELVVTQTTLNGSIPPLASLSSICLDAENHQQLLSRHSDKNIAKGRLQLTSQHLAYVIYTSGSTGRPKGVLTPHQGVTRLVIGNSYAPLSNRTVMGQCATITFDAATFEVWGALLNGGRLVLYPQPVIDILQLHEFIHNNHINTIWLTSGLFDQFATDTPKLNSLKYILTGGDIVSPHTVSKLYSTNPDLIIINGYGPTENTTFTCCFTTSPSLGVNRSVPIGRPIKNSTVYVLSPNQSLQPIGVAGELYIGGAGLARGYLNRPDLTAEKFIPNPFNDDPNDRLYRTGDLVRWLPDGNLEFLGRIDHQVKIRGFRIELGEIEAVLLQHEAIREAVVVAREDRDDKRLVAYVVTAADKTTSNAFVLIEDLRQTIKQQLPDYMTPSAFVTLDSFPLTPNGKVDRNALPAPDYTPQVDYIAPTSPIETQLGAIWREVLGLDQVSVDANFFTVGGDSIKAMQVASRAQRAGLALTTRQQFTHQTIAELALQVTAKVEADAPQKDSEGAQTLLPIQQHFLATQPIGAQHFNQAVRVSLPAGVTEESLHQALAAIVARHDVLRLAFQQQAPHWRASYRSIAPEAIAKTIQRLSLPPMAEDARRRQIIEKANPLQASFDLAQPPLIRWLWVYDEATAASELIWIMHHLIVDGVSWRILLQDLQQALEQYAASATITLAPKTSSYQAWAEQLEAYSETSACQQTASYWRQTLSQPAPDLPARPLSSTDSLDYQQTAYHSLQLSETLTQQLLQQSNACYHTQINDLLLTALLLAVTDWTGGDSLRVDLEGHGRETLFEEINLSETVGWFTSVFPVHLRKATNASADSAELGEHIKAVKEQLRQIPNKGIDYGVLQRFQSDALPEHQPSAVVFNYLGQFDQTNALQLSMADTGESAGPRLQREHLLGFNCLVASGQWRLTLDYHSGQFAAEQIAQLADRYRFYLTEIIRHCAHSAGSHTPSDFPLVKLSQRQLDRLQQDYPTLEDLYPSTPMQQGMLFHTELSGDTGVYMTRLGIMLRQLDPLLFQQCWRSLIARHAILRTAFASVEGQEPLQLVQSQAEAPWRRLDWRPLSETEQQATLQALLEETPHYDLRRAPLMDFTLAQTGDSDYWFVWRHHHALLDGWCLPILFKELLTLYQHGANQQSLPLPAVAPFREYIAWLQQQSSTQAEDYWRAYLAGFNAPTALPGARPSIATADAQPQQEAGLTLSATLTTQLQQLAQSQQVTLNSVVQAAWGLLLSRYSGEQDVVFGGTRSGRPEALPGAEFMVGLFINSVPMRLQLTGNLSIADCLQQLHKAQASHDHYSYAPLVDIQHWSEIGGGRHLFESLLVFENYPLDASLTESTSSSDRFVIAQVIANEQTNYPLSLSIVPDDRLHFKLLYQPQRFAEDSIRRLLTHLQQLLIAMTRAEASSAMSGLNMLTEQETRQLLIDWNQTAAPYPADQCIHELFEAQAAKSPQAVAVVFADDALTYDELNRRANQLAHYLIEQGVKPDSLVGLCVERSLEMIIGLLGILKAGGAYVPLDPSAPPARIQAILDDCQPVLLISQTRCAESLSSYSGALVCLDADWSIIESSPGSQSPVSSRSNDLAYVIYTSGSTGKPKGVLQHHQTLLNLVQHQALEGQLIQAMRTLQLTNITFDVALQEIVTSWFTGSCLVLIHNDARLDMSQLAAVLSNQRIERLFIAPALLQALTDFLNKQKILLPYVKEIITAGEALQITGSLHQFMQTHPSCGLWNHYGPSETHVVTIERVKEFNVGDIPAIGKPLKNHQCYVVNQQNQLQPIGAPGELLVSGTGLARGYLNRPDLTAEKFIPNPFSDGANDRLYRTGDLVRWLPDGDLEFLGRIDHQVKIRGFRIELGEIEAVLLQHEAIREAVVVAREDRDDKRLVAYVVTAADKTTSNAFVLIEDLRQIIKQQLPDYMTPSAFVTLDSLPLTPNGKVDRNALPAPDYAASADEFMAPATPTECKLADIWRSLLQIDHPLSASANFFESGGHSLLVMRLVSAISDQFGAQIAIRDIFGHSQLKDLATFIDAYRTEDRLREWKPLVRLSDETLTNKVSSKLFCVPGAGGFSIAYQALSDELSQFTQVLVFEAKGLDGAQEPHNDWNALISCYLDAITIEQPIGPYYLLGHSFGGRVVFELARKLEARSQEVHVIILDTVLSNSILSSEVSAMPDMSVAEKVLHVIDEFLGEASIDPNRNFPSAKEKVKQLMVMGGLLPANGNTQLLDGFLEVYAAQESLFNQYKPSGRLDGKLLFLYSEDSYPGGKLLLAIENYNQLCAQPINAHKVDGGHVSMLRAKNVHSIASAIAPILATERSISMNSKSNEEEMLL